MKNRSLKRNILVSIPIVLIAIFFGVYQYYFYEGPELDQERCQDNQQYDLTIFAAELDDFIRKFHDPANTFQPDDLRGRFSIHEGGSTDLYGSCDLVYILWITDQLHEKTTEMGRREWADLIRSFQDPETGLFSKNIVAGESVTHATAFSSAALKLLDSKPQYPHYWAKKIFSSPSSIDQWLDSFNWHEIWTGSHEMGRAAALIDAPQGVQITGDWKHWLVKAMNSRIDPHSGFWKNGIGDYILRDPTTVDLGGAAHFWWIYHHLDRKIPYAEKAIEGILSLQKDSGIWGNRLFNGPFPQGIDFDAVNGYRFAYHSLSSKQQNRYRERIIDSLNIYACAVHSFLNRPGAIHEYYHSAHKLVGTLNAIAETNQLHTELTGEPIFILPKTWKSALDVVTWQ